MRVEQVGHRGGKSVELLGRRLVGAPLGVLQQGHQQKARIGVAVSITILGLRRSARGQDPVMAGSVYFLVIVAIGAVIAAVTGTIFLLIPFVLIAIGFLLVPVAGALRGTRAGERSEGQGVPSTREASYDPVQEPKVP